ncbi:MAG: phosphotransferase [Chloroflexi bacterium]|nr:phosphotransferase [Chloroflexota bacterium]
MNAFIHDLSAYVTSLREQGRPLYPSALRWVLLANGAADLNDSVIFFGFEGAGSEPVLVVKAPRIPQNDWMLKIEFDRLTDLWAILGDEASLYLPKPIAFTQLGSQSILILSFLNGESLTRASKGTLWKKTDDTIALAVKVARSLRYLDDKTATVIKDSDRPFEDFQTKADKFQQLFSLTEKEIQALNDLTNFIKTSAANASHKILLQGDFWHGNLIREPSQDRLMIVDWQFARWSTDASLDVYLFIMAGAFTAARRLGDENAAKTAAGILSRWRSDVIPEYLKAYGQPEKFVLLPLRYGMLSCCVEKAIRSEIEFGYNHPDDEMWRNLFTELMDWPAD